MPHDHFRRAALIAIACSAGLGTPAQAASASGPSEPRIVTLQQLPAELAKLSGDVFVQFTSTDPGCGYCMRANRDMPLALQRRGVDQPYLRVQWSPWRSFPAALAGLPVTRPINAIPVVVVFRDGRETERVEGADPWTNSLNTAPAAPSPPPPAAYAAPAAAVAAAPPPAIDRAAAVTAPPTTGASGPHVEPASVTLLYGQTIGLRALGFAAAGSTAPAFAWRSSAPDVASVDASGRVQLKRRGSATITVQRGTVTATATIKVMGFTTLGETHANYTCALPDDRRQIYCWGDAATNIPTDRGFVTRFTNPVPIAPGAIPTGSQIIDVRSNSFSSCALTDSGRVFCFGNAQYGALGLPKATGSVTPAAHIPVEIAGGESPPKSKFVAIGVGPTTACAATDTSQLYCWGNTTPMPIDRTRRSSQPLLQPIATLRGDLPARARITEVAVSVNGGCLLADGQPYCWPMNGKMQPSRVEPGDLPLAVRLRRLKSDDFTCALGDDGQAYCMGTAMGSRFGDGLATFRTDRRWHAASAPAGGGRFTNLSLGGNAASTCSIVETGAVQCWGKSYLGSAADGNAATHDVLSPSPTQRGEIPENVQLADVVCGQYHCAALGDDGRLYAWGSNQGNALGRDGLSRSAVPIAVAPPLAR